MDSSAQNVKNESISNSVLISSSGILSTLASSNMIAGNNQKFSVWRVLHQLLKDVLSRNL